jgi:hypothetical protein
MPPVLCRERFNQSRIFEFCKAAIEGSGSHPYSGKLLDVLDKGVAVF